MSFWTSNLSVSFYRRDIAWHTLTWTSTFFTYMYSPVCIVCICSRAPGILSSCKCIATYSPMMSIMRKFKELQRPSYCAHHHAHCSSTNPSKVQWFRLFISHLYSSRGPSSLFNAPLPVRSSHWPIYLIADSPVLWRRRRLSATQRPMHGPWWTQIIILLLEMIRSPLDKIIITSIDACIAVAGDD